VTADLCRKYALADHKTELHAFAQQGLAEAHISYRDDRGASFETWAYHCIRNHILRGARAMNLFRSQQMVSWESMTETEAHGCRANSLDEPLTPEDHLVARQEAALFESALEAVDEETRAWIVASFLERRTLQELVADSGRSVAWGSRMRQRSLQRVQEWIRNHE